MLPRMTTRSAGWSTAAQRGGRTGGRTGRGGGRIGEQTGRGGGQTGEQNGQGDNRGNKANGGIEEVPNFSMVIAQQLQDLFPSIIAQVVQTRGQESIVGITWEDFKALMRGEFCPNNEMQKVETEFWCHVMVGAGYAAYTDRFYELSRKIRGMVAATEPTTTQSAILKAGVLTDEAIRDGSLKKNTKKIGNSGEPSKDGDVKGDNKRSRTGRAFSIITNPVRI
ncbi:hypothetical protein Tco_1248430 [Tanacetum coccineum]